MKLLCKIIFILFFANCQLLPTFVGTNLFANSTKTDSLLKALQTTTHDTTRINTLNDLAWELKFNNPDTAIYYSKQALTLAEKLVLSGDEGAEWEKGIANSYRNLGAFNYLKGNYPLALDHYNKALSINNRLNDKKGIATTLGNIGLVYSGQGDYPKALEYYFKALKINKEFGRKINIANNLGNIGIVYYDQGDYPKALEYYFKSLKMREELENKSLIAIQLGNIGSVYYDQGDYPKTLEYYFKALKMDEELGDKSGIASWLGGIGIVYAKQAERNRSADKVHGGIGINPSDSLYNKALEYHFKALKMDEELRNKNGIARHLGNIGSLYTEQKKYTKAERYLLQALEVSTEIGALSLIKDHNQSLSDLYEQTRRYQRHTNTTLNIPLQKTAYLMKKRART